MKILTKLIKFILITIFAVSIIYIGITQVVSSTILKKEYIINKLEETNFFNETYKLVESNFEKYIYQSGLDEEVLEKICTEEKVKKDIELILSNIYDGTNKQIDTTEISQNLNTNIDKFNIKNNKNKEAIEQFVKHICDEYVDTLIHTQYENKINKGYNQINNIVSKSQKAFIGVLIVDLIIIIVINIRKISKILQDLGISLLVVGSFELITHKIITTKVNIEGIKIFNDAFSETIVSIIQEVLEKVVTLGRYAIILSIILIVLYAVISAIQITKEKEEKQTTDN